MFRDRSLTAGLALSVALVATPAAGQSVPPPPAQPAPAAPLAPVPPPSAESLETPYGEPAAPVDAPPPAALPAPPPPTAAPMRSVRPAEDHADPPQLPIRAERRLALTGELGWNGLAGFGPVLTYYAHPNFALDLGLGFSLLGAKAGIRGRYNLLKGSTTPFVGLGFNSTTGFGKVTTDPASDPNGDPNREPATLNVKASYLVQGVVGVDFIHRRGFTLVGCIGYSHLLNKNNVQVLDGELTEDEEQGFNIAFKGGFVLSLALGYAFK